MMKLTSAQRQEIVRLVQEHILTGAEIAARYGVSSSTVSAIAKSSGVQRSKSGKRRVNCHPLVLTAEYLRLIITYDSKSGKFFWVRSGKAAGWSDDLGYVHIRIGRKLYLAHRLAWFHVYGLWPQRNLDHVNGEPSDNRIANLRECGQEQNSANSKVVRTTSSIRKGVSFDNARNLFRAYITQRGKQTLIGRFDTAEAAIAARIRVEREVQGEFARR